MWSFYNRVVSFKKWLNLVASETIEGMDKSWFREKMPDLESWEQAREEILKEWASPFEAAILEARHHSMYIQRRSNKQLLADIMNHRRGCHRDISY